MVKKDVLGDVGIQWEDFMKKKKRGSESPIPDRAFKQNLIQFLSKEWVEDWRWPRDNKRKKFK